MDIAINSRDKKQFHLLSSAEGKLFIVGSLIAFLSILALVFYGFFSPDRSKIYLGMIIANIAFGRAAGLAVGFTAELNFYLVVFLNALIETVLVLMTYPLFVFGWRRMRLVKGLAKIFLRIEKTAERNRSKVQKYGVFGLSVFVLIPFWMTGPVIGSVIGFMIGLKLWKNLCAVLIGTHIATVLWGCFLRSVHLTIKGYTTVGPFVLLALIILLSVGGHFLHRKEHREI